MAGPITESNVSEACFVASVLINAYDAKDAATQLYPPKQVLDGVKFASGDGDYKNGHDILPAISESHLSQLKVTTPGGATSYYRKIADNDPGAAPAPSGGGGFFSMLGGGARDEKEGAHGFRASAWIKTDKDGNPLVGDNGKHEVVVTFPGYRGNPLNDNEAQTQALHAVGNGLLNPQASQVAGFMQKVNDKLAEMQVRQPDMHVAAHSLGSSNAMEAAVHCEQCRAPAASVLLLEPVAASLAVDHLAAGHALDRNGKPQQRKDVDGKPVAQVMEDILDRTVSVRTYVTDGKSKTGFSNSARLETFKPVDEKGGEVAYRPDKKDQRNKEGLDYLQMQNKNNGTGAGGRDGAADRDNRMVGTAYLMPGSAKGYTATTLAGRFDPTHAGHFMMQALQKGAEVLGLDKVITDAKKAEQEVQKSGAANPRLDQQSAIALPKYLQAAVEQGRNMLAAAMRPDAGNLKTVTETLADSTARNSGNGQAAARGGPALRT